MKRYILNEYGEPKACEDLMQWAEWYETADRRVALDRVEDFTISTVFLALDYSFMGAARPIVWETMVFKGGESMFFDRCGGSSEQALAMHEDMKAKMQTEAYNLRNACAKLTHNL